MIYILFFPGKTSTSGNMLNICIIKCGVCGQSNVQMLTCPPILKLSDTKRYLGFPYDLTELIGETYGQVVFLSKKDFMSFLLHYCHSCKLEQYTRSLAAVDFSGTVFTCALKRQTSQELGVIGNTSVILVHLWILHQRRIQWGCWGCQRTPEFRGSQKGQSLISAYHSLAITTPPDLKS